MVNTPAQPPPNTSQKNIVSAAKGGGIIFMGRLFEYAGRFVLGVLLARFMGSEQYGVYALASTVLAIVTGFAMVGLGEGLVYYIPRFRNQNDDNSIWGTLLISLSVPLTVSLVASVGILFMGDVIVSWFHEPQLLAVLPVVSLAIPLNVLMLIAIQITQGFKRMRYKVIAQDITLIIVKIVLVIPLIFIGLNAVLAMATHTIGLLIAAILPLYFLHTRLFPLNRPLTSATFHWKALFSFSLPVYFTHLIMTFGDQLQTILLGILSTSVAVGVFTAAYRVSMIGKMFHASIVMVAMPLVSDLYSQKAWPELGHFYQTVTKWTFTLNLPMALIIFLFAEPILLIFGESFITDITFTIGGYRIAAGPLALIILGLANLTGAATGICGVIITMTDRPWLNTFNSALALSSTLALNIWLIPLWGVVGAAVAQLVAVIILNTTRIIQIVVLYRLGPYNRGFLKPIFAGLIAAIATYFLDGLILADMGIVGIIVNIIFLLGLYTVAILALGLTADDHLILSRVGHRLRPWLPAIVANRFKAK